MLFRFGCFRVSSKLAPLFVPYRNQQSAYGNQLAKLINDPCEGRRHKRD